MGNGFFSKQVQILELISKTSFAIVSHKQPFLESDSAYKTSTKLPQIDQLGGGCVLKIFFSSSLTVKRSNGGLMWRSTFSASHPRKNESLLQMLMHRVVKYLLLWFSKCTFELNAFYLSWFFIQTEQVTAMMAQASSQIPYRCFNLHCCAQNRWAAVDTHLCEMHMLSYRIST